MKQQTIPPLVLEVFRSKALTLFVHLLHTFLLAIFLLSGLKFTVLIVSILIIFLSWWLCWHDYLALFSPVKPLTLRILPNGNWLLVNHKRGCSELQMVGYSVVCDQVFVSFEFNPNGPSKLLLLFDCMSATSLRQLRVRLNELVLVDDKIQQLSQQ